MISSLSSGEPNTALPSAFSTSFWLFGLARKAVPWYACAAAVTKT